MTTALPIWSTSFRPPRVVLRFAAVENPIVTQGPKKAWRHRSLPPSPNPAPHGPSEPHLLRRGQFFFLDNYYAYVSILSYRLPACMFERCIHVFGCDIIHHAIDPACMHACMYVCTYVHMYVCVHVCMYVLMYVCIDVYMY